MDEIINLSNAFSSGDDITIISLGEEVISYIGEENSNTYLDFYLKMLNRITGTIPPINININNKTYKSGEYSNSERLLIGKKVEDSCIDLLNSAGKETFKECLIEEDGDVIIVRDSNNEISSRILIFRRGNVVQLVTSFGQGHPIEIYEQILEQAISKEDNIDYVLVDVYSVIASKNEYFKNKYEIIDDYGLQEMFPHADLSGEALLINSKNKILGIEESSINLDFDVTTKAKYNKLRKPISYYPKDNEISRIRALKIILEENIEIKETLARNFEIFYNKDYLKVFSGEDLYIAIKNDGTIEEIILPLNDPRIKLEVEEIKRQLNLPEETNKYRR